MVMVLTWREVYADGCIAVPLKDALFGILSASVHAYHLYGG